MHGKGEKQKVRVQLNEASRPRRFLRGLLPRRLGCLTAAIVLGACSAQPANDAIPGDASPERAATENGALVDDNIARIRDATIRFQSLDSAVEAGYSREGGRCIEHQPHGAMGYHHVNRTLLDDRIEIEKPEMLVYEKMPDSTYRLNGVEYIVPFSVWEETREPPTVMGQALKPSEQLGIWYRHVWVWRDNPSGMFEDWNPLVKC
jgi:hypothetical protein